MDWIVRAANHTDGDQVLELYRRVARIPGQLARTEQEVTLAFVEKLLGDAIGHGMALVLERRGSHRVVGMIHAVQGSPASLRHVMGKLTILVDPAHQNQGGGRALFSRFLGEIERYWPEILRVELRARASNAHALRLYERLGFQREGLFLRRIQGVNGELEDGIPMAWLNPTFKREIQQRNNRPILHPEKA